MPIIRKLSRHSNSSQITVPVEVIQHLNVRKGDYLVWTIDKHSQVVLDKLTAKKYPGFFIPGSGWLKRV